ncbi:MAG: 30S ribosomal protein S8e [Candidatus Heimdallarchaeota archaeon]
MARWQGLSRRTKSGARLKKHHEKRKAELGRPEAQTIIGEKRIKPIRTRGDNRKIRAYRLNECNLSDPETGKSEKVKIIDVETNAANKEYTRRKIMTKGALIRTEKGYAIITNRPGQEGFISAIPTEIDVDATQQRTISAKKKKRQTLQVKKVGSAAGTQKKASKPAEKKPAAAKPKPKPAAEKPVAEKKETTTKKTTTAAKPKVAKEEKPAKAEKKTTAAKPKTTAKKTEEKKE